MNDLPKLPGGWVWKFVCKYACSDNWTAYAVDKDDIGGIAADRPTSAEAIARVVAMVEAVVGSEVKRD